MTIRAKFIGLAAVLGVSMACERLVAADNGETAYIEAIDLLAKGGSGEKGQAKLQEAWKRVAAVDAGAVFKVLGGMKGASATGENWLRSAADAILAKHLRGGGELPADDFEQFVLDQSQAPRARRTAFEWLSQVDESAPGRLLPQMFDDSSLELRFDAVQQVIDAAAAAREKEAKAPLYRQALAAARDVKQIKTCAGELEKLGEKINLVEQMGFLSRWRLIGPFDNVGLEGYAKAYAPEANLAFGEEVEGKNGKMKWIDHETKDGMGMVDLNKALVEDKEIVAYAAATFTSPRDQAGQLRLGSSNATRVWFNGEDVGGREVYHSGWEVDQNIMPVKVREGENVVLVKVCQNAREEVWEKHWSFQLRVTDELGGPLDVEQK